MRVADSFVVSTPIEATWRVFGDPAELAACVPGVEGVAVVDDQHYDAAMVVKVSFMTIRFAVHGELLEQEAPAHMVVELAGEPVAFAGAFQATLTVDLSEVAGGTTISYEVDAHLTGRLASLGEALLNATAAGMGQEFASNLKARLESGAA